MTLYRQAVLDRFHNPRFKGVIKDTPLTITESNPLCGDRISLSLRLIDGQIVAAMWQGEGCAISLAAADFLVEKVIGMTIEQVQTITDAEMVDLLKVDFGPARLKCATLALMAMRKIK